MSGAIPPLPQYAFMAWCLVKAQGTTLPLQQSNCWRHIKNAWRFVPVHEAGNSLVWGQRMRGAITPLPQYVFMARCLVKHRDYFTFTFTLKHVFWDCTSYKLNLYSDERS